MSRSVSEIALMAAMIDAQNPYLPQLLHLEIKDWEKAESDYRKRRAKEAVNRAMEIYREAKEQVEK